MESLSLYIHVPFCTSKCSYCDFYSRAPGEGELLPVLDRIVEETAAALDRLAPEKVKTAFIGGGTPSILAPDLMDAFLKKISALLPGQPVEWSCEVNPESLKKGHLQAFQASGVNRISMGIQSFSPRTLSTLGRGAGPEDILRSLDLLKSQWQNRWSGDLICEVPGQTRAEALEDIQKLTSYNPSHISLYALTMEEGTPLGDRYLNNSAEENGSGALPAIDRNLWASAAQELENQGWDRYEVSNFSRDGAECLHNLVYWDMEPFIGVGPAASSTFPRDGVHCRRTNPSSVDGYMSIDIRDSWSESGPLIETISSDDFLIEFLMMGLRKTRGIGTSRFISIFGNPLEEFVPGWVEENIKKKRLISDKAGYRLTREGMTYLNPLLVDLMTEIDPS